MFDNILRTIIPIETNITVARRLCKGVEYEKIKKKSEILSLRRFDVIEIT